MRRSALLGPLLLLGGCSGLGHFFSDTARLPGQNPNATTGVSENLQRSRGVEPTTEPIRPQDGNVWPGPPQPLPTLSDVSHFGIQGEGGALLGGTGGTGGTGGAMPRGGSMSMGEGESVRHGAAVDDGGFAGGGTGMGSALSGSGLSTGVADPATRFHGGSGGGSGGGGSGAHGAGGSGDGGGNIVIPNGDGTSTVISPDGSVKTVKGTPK